MNRAERRWRTRKVQARRYNLVRDRNETKGSFTWRGEWREPMHWFNDRDYGQLRNDLKTWHVAYHKAHECDCWMSGKRVKAIRANIDFAEELEDLGFTHNLSMSINGSTGLWD